MSVSCILANSEKWTSWCSKGRERREEGRSVNATQKSKAHSTHKTYWASKFEIGFYCAAQQVTGKNPIILS